jgi:hypothetical protein
VLLLSLLPLTERCVSLRQQAALKLLAKLLPSKKQQQQQSKVCCDCCLGPAASLLCMCSIQVAAAHCSSNNPQAGMP